MKLKFPWVSRERYEETVRDRDRRIAQLEERERLLLNTLAELGWGMPLFPPAERATAEAGAVNTPAEEGAKEAGDPNQEFPDSLLELAMRDTGSRNPRVLCRYIDRVLDRNNGTPEQVLERIKQVEAEGVSQGMASAAAREQEA